MYDSDLKISGLSLVPSPPSQLSSFAARIMRKRFSENHLVMYATINNSYGGGLGTRIIWAEGSWMGLAKLQGNCLIMWSLTKFLPLDIYKRYKSCIIEF